MNVALAEILQSQKLLNDGQALVEKGLLPPDDNEPWRESLDDDV
jgi:hypothetical protein